MSATALAMPAADTTTVKTFDQEIREIILALLPWLANIQVPRDGIRRSFRLTGKPANTKPMGHSENSPENFWPCGSAGLEDMVNFMELSIGGKASWFHPSIAGHAVCTIKQDSFSSALVGPQWWMEFRWVKPFGQPGYVELKISYSAGTLSQQE